MNTHKNARLTFARRREMVRDLIEWDVSPTAVGAAQWSVRRPTQARIARSVGVSEGTASRVLSRAGLSRWSALEPSTPSVPYEHRHPGDMVHPDTKKLGAYRAHGASDHR